MKRQASMQKRGKSGEIEAVVEPPAHGGWLGGFSEMLQNVAERDESTRLKWNEELGEPDKFIEIDGEPFALFKIDGGAMMIQRRKNGYHKSDARVFEDALILALYSLVSNDG